MITAVDTNVLIDLLEQDLAAARQARNALEFCAEEGGLSFSMVCYGELAVRFISQRALDYFLDGSGIVPETLSGEAAFVAGKLFAEHARRGGRQGRMLADFLVGAHAITMADRLLTRDRRFYAESFRRLKVISPESFPTT